MNEEEKEQFYKDYDKRIQFLNLTDSVFWIRQTIIRSCVFLGIGLLLLIPMILLWGEKINILFIMVSSIFIFMGILIFIFALIKKGNKNKQNKRDEEHKSQIANHAFNKFLEPGKDYSIYANIENQILVKKEINWAYYNKKGGKLEAEFTITTDKGIFTFLVEDKDLPLVQIEFVTGLVEIERQCIKPNE